MTLSIQENVSLKELTTLKIGGRARYVISVVSDGELKKALAFARQKRAPFVVLGGGSNVLAGDSGFGGLVIKNEIKGMVWRERKLKNKSEKGKTKEEKKRKEHIVLVVCGAGENWDALAAETVSHGLWGIENLSGIPGTVGAAPVQNIGAYGVELAHVLEWVEAFDSKNMEARRFSNEECRFGYRDSVFKKPEWKQFIITRVALRLSKDWKPNFEYYDLQKRFKIKDLRFKKERVTPLDIRKAVLEIRKKKFPDLKRFGTAGSFFKNPIITQEQFEKLKKRYPDLPGYEVHDTNPRMKTNDTNKMVKLSLAWVLDNICGLRGFAKGGVSLFEQQPIVLVNTGAATSEEVKNFAREISRRVKEKTGIEIEPEVVFIGDGKK